MTTLDWFFVVPLSIIFAWVVYRIIYDSFFEDWSDINRQISE